MTAVRILLLTFTSRDFLSIRKVIISPRSLPMIVTLYGHILYTNGMPSKKIMESLRTFVFVETVLRRGQMFQGVTEFIIIYFIMLNKKIRSA